MAQAAGAASAPSTTAVPGAHSRAGATAPLGASSEDATAHASEPAMLARTVATIERRWRWVLGALLLADALLLLYMGRGLTFFFDEWDYVTHDYGGGIHSLLVAHNGHMSVVPVAVYKLLFHLVGLNHYAVFRLVLIALHLLCAGLVFVLVTRRQTRVFALLATALILFLGAAWEDLLWAFQIDYMLSIAGGLAAWVLLERRDRLGDVGATIAVVVSVASSGLGLPVLFGVIVELAYRREWRRGLVVVIPAVLYGLWYLGYGEDVITHEGLINSPGFSQDIAAAAFGSLTGHGVDWGRPLALLGFIVLLWRLARPGTLTPRLAGLLATGLSLWLVTAAARSTISSPETGRYVYLGAVVILLVSVELARGIALGSRVLALATIVVAMFAITGLALLRNGAVGLRSDAKTVTAELGALELAAALAPASYQPDPHLAPQILAGPYLHTVRAIGSSPADSPTAMLAADESSRAAADGVLLALDSPALRSGPAALPRLTGPPPRLLAVAAGTATSRGGCVLLRPTAGTGMTAVLALASGELQIRDRGVGPAVVAVRRFGESFVGLSGSVAPHGVASVSFPADAARAVPWQLQLSSSSALSVCAT